MPGHRTRSCQVAQPSISVPLSVPFTQQPAVTTGVPRGSRSNERTSWTDAHRRVLIWYRIFQQPASKYNDIALALGRRPLACRIEMCRVQQREVEFEALKRHMGTDYDPVQDLISSGNASAAAIIAASNTSANPSTVTDSSSAEVSHIVSPAQTTTTITAPTEDSSSEQPLYVMSGALPSTTGMTAAADIERPTTSWHSINAPSNGINPPADLSTDVYWPTSDVRGARTVASKGRASRTRASRRTTTPDTTASETTTSEITTPGISGTQKTRRKKAAAKKTSTKRTSKRTSPAKTGAGVKKRAATRRQRQVDSVTASPTPEPITGAPESPSVAQIFPVSTTMDDPELHTVEDAADILLSMFQEDRWRKMRRAWLESHGRTPQDSTRSIGNDRMIS